MIIMVIIIIIIVIATIITITITIIMFFDECGNGSDVSSLTMKDNNPDINNFTSLSGFKFPPQPIINSKTNTNYECKNPGDCIHKN